MKRTVLALSLAFASLALFAAVERAPAARASSTSAGFPFHIDRIVESFDGTVDEAIAVSGYTYFHVDVAGGSDHEQRWVASLKKPFVAGQRVHVTSFGRQQEFASPKLHRTFNDLYFAVVTNAQ
jgi:type IV secretory pathway VirB2 component (pilin)